MSEKQIRIFNVLRNGVQFRVEGPDGYLSLPYYAVRAAIQDAVNIAVTQGYDRFEIHTNINPKPTSDSVKASFNDEVTFWSENVPFTKRAHEYFYSYSGKQHGRMADAISYANLYPKTPNAPEPAPKPNGNPHIWDLVVEDMKERNKLGYEKYKTYLQGWNGRNTKRERYQELLDLVVYFRQEIWEDENPKPKYENVKFPNRHQAENTLQDLRMLIEKYGNVSVAEYYSFNARFRANTQGLKWDDPELEKVGWTNLDHVKIKQMIYTAYHSDFWIDMPEPGPIGPPRNLDRKDRWPMVALKGRNDQLIFESDSPSDPSENDD